MRQSPSRNQRSRGWKVKHVLQMCVLVAVCVWLAYQVKHSHDKKKALEEGNSQLSGRVEGNGANLLKLGRKDPHGNVVIMDTDNSTQSEEEETREAEEAAAGHENKQEENEGEGRGSGGNEIEHNGAGEGAEHGEESRDGEAKEERPGDAGSSDGQDHEGADADGSSQEAREEHYKADDASSAVVRGTQEMDQENGNLITENSEEQKEKTEVVEEELGNGGTTNVTGDASKDGEVHDNPVDGESQQPNNSSSESVIEVYSDTTSSSHDLMRQQNNLNEAVPDEQVETQSTSAGVGAETVGSFENATVVDMASAQDQNAVNEGRTLGEDNSNLEKDSTTLEHDDQIEQRNNSTETVSDEQAETRAISQGVHAETVDSYSENVTVDTGSAQDQTTVNETTTLAEDNSNTENTPLEQTEKSDPNGAHGSDESQRTASSTDGNGDVVQGEATTSSSGNVVGVTEEEQAAGTNLSTLPESETKSGEGVAAE